LHSGRMQFSACGNDPPSSSGKRRKARKRRPRSVRASRAGGRYDVLRHAETQYQPGSNRRVLQNLLSIRSVREMARVEQREFIRMSGTAVRTYEPHHRFTAKDLCELHRSWLGDVYAWAGEYREVNVSKGGFLFAAAGHIPRLMQEFETDCLARNTPLHADGRRDLALALAETHTEFLLLHPFRDGNGRMARLLAVLMALQAGIQKPRFDLMLTRQKAEYFAAVRAGLDRNYEPMRRIFASILSGDAL